MHSPEYHNNVYIDATESETNEILNALSFESKKIELYDFNDKIDWIDTKYGNKNYYSFTTYGYTARPWNPSRFSKNNDNSIETKLISEVTKSYPSAVFHWECSEQKDGSLSYEQEYLEQNETWVCNQHFGNKYFLEQRKDEAYIEEAKRFIASNNIYAEGNRHKVSLNDDGSVLVYGINRYGECNVKEWQDIVQISCGNWHTVGLKKDGTLVACGSNVNDQCYISRINGKAIAISCGRYHTAVLLDTGKVIIKGSLEQKPSGLNANNEKNLLPENFPLTYKLCLDRYIDGWQDMNERIENICDGDELKLDVNRTTSNSIIYDVLCSTGEKIGELYDDHYSNQFNKMLSDIKVYACDVMPLSKRSSRAKYGTLNMRLEYVNKENLAAKSPDELGGYKQTGVNEWPPVVKIKSVFDAVIGITENGEVYVDGFCPCTDAEIKEIIKNV